MHSFRLLVLAAIVIRSASAETELVIPNQLGLSWPGELVSFDLKKNQIPAGDLTLEVQGLERPAQRVGNQVWSYVTIRNRDDEGQKLEISNVPVVLKSKSISPGITVTRKDGHYLIDNEVYQFRLRDYPGRPLTTMPLKDFPHWCGGMKTKEQKDWDGKAYFESNAPVVGAKTELVQVGPVFADFKVTYFFEGETGEEVAALPLALGKQAHLFDPNQVPQEMVPARTHAYELMLRFVMDDPWIDINERFHFPRDEKASPFGVSQYYLEWGEQGMKVDTVSWVRWFEYDRFGGNTTQQYLPAKPRPAQKGRPFALLRPRWNQGGGGAQDFMLTAGGPPHGKDGKAPAGYDPDQPAVGVVAAYASKWVGPYVNYIPVYVYDGNRGRARFPLADGERSGMHYGQRAYGLLVGPRKSMASLNSVVRRHTDWTLTAQINKYILDWKRDSSKAGPNILLTRKDLAKLQADYKSKRKTPVNEAIRLLEEKSGAKIKERDKLREGLQKALEKAAEDLEKARQAKADSAKIRELDKAYREARDAAKKSAPLKELEKSLKGLDYDLHRLITTGQSRKVAMPSSDLWLSRRYQDDFLNPTSSPTRRVKDFATADLFANGENLGGASQAAMGYISTDLDAWPGWKQGWRPGNPNFHTDKYMAALFVGGALADHPHAREWLEFGFDNFREDMEKVLLEPDGVGAECPGYAGYAMKLQMEIGQILRNTGFGNVIAENPLVAGHAIWHRKLITPFDRRIGRRHEAPHGDTHRWDAGLYASGFSRLATFYKEANPKLASELVGVAGLLRGSGPDGKAPSLKDLVGAVDPDIVPMPAEKMDWSSQTFRGFGAIMRDGFGTPKESFVSFKAGPARGHYHNDELAYHFYSNGTPISLDYNCSYTPRGDHAALHNSMTFGREGSLNHNGDGRKVATQEEFTSDGEVMHFKSTPVADLVVAERSGNTLVQRPIDPKDHEFGRDYPTREVGSLSHERSLLFVKRPDSSSDYLVVRDRTKGGEKQQLNIHLLARSIESLPDGRTFLADGQWDQDMMVFLAEVSEPRVDVRSWYYLDEWMTGPADYILKSGESGTAWDARLDKMKNKAGASSLPVSNDWKPVWQDPKEEGALAWRKTVRDTGGRALLPPRGWKESWMYGEYQTWLRVESKPGSTMTWMLFPFEKGTERPKLEMAEGVLRISHGGLVDEVVMDPDGSVTVKRDGKETVLSN